MAVDGQNFGLPGFLQAPQVFFGVSLEIAQRTNIFELNHPGTSTVNLQQKECYTAR
jgi:hypothetical protein